MAYKIACENILGVEWILVVLGRNLEEYYSQHKLTSTERRRRKKIAIGL